MNGSIHLVSVDHWRLYNHDGPAWLAVIRHNVTAFPRWAGQVLTARAVVDDFGNLVTVGIWS